MPLEDCAQSKYPKIYQQLVEEINQQTKPKVIATQYYYARKQKAKGVTPLAFLLNRVNYSKQLFIKAQALLQAGLRHESQSLQSLIAEHCLVE